MIGGTKKKVKRLVCAVIVVLLLLVGGAKEAKATPDSNSIVVNDLKFYVETDKSVYYLGECVGMLYRVTNLGLLTVTIPCGRSPELNLVVRKDGQTIWMKHIAWWHFSPGLEVEPGPDKAIEMTSDWDMKDFNDVLIQPGIYDVLGVIYGGLGMIPDVGVQISILAEPRCGDPYHPYPVGDLNEDCRVDLRDLAVLSLHWLKCTAPECETIVAGNINGDCKVDFFDFAMLANNWLRTSFVESIFDFAVATKGALNLQGNIEIGGASIFIDASVYIESLNDANALHIIGNSHIAGDVFIINPDATVTLQGGQASIGGETGQDAIDNHVNFGAPSTEFPVPEPNYFRHYVQNTYDPNNVLTKYDNVIIPAGTNPSFGAVTLRGVVFIEAPNIVLFNGNTEITGIIVGNGDLNDDSGTNQVWFTGTISSYPVTNLPNEPQFEQLRDETGTFLMAPGFKAIFFGNFDTLNGAIAANGIEFGGNAGGTIDGSVLNYSDSPMTLSGNSDLLFNRSGTAQMPAGFD